MRPPATRASRGCVCACSTRRRCSRVRRQLTVLYLELESSQLPPGKTIKVDISSPQALEKLEHTPIQVKEGADYKCVAVSEL